METGSPNLDGMTSEELMSFWKETNSVRPIKKARELFPDRQENYVRITKQLGNYAANKATAMRCRSEGRIQAALTYEGICDRIYGELPEFARW